MLERHGLPPLSLEVFYAGFCLPLRVWFATLGVPSAETENAARAWNREIGRRPAILAAGAREALTLLKASGVRLGVVSAASRDTLRRDLERPALAGLAEQLDFIVGDAEPKRAALFELSRAGPQHYIYVGDTEYDILEARAAGVRSIGYAGGYRPAAGLIAAGADYVIERLSELPRLLEDIGALARSLKHGPDLSHG